LPQEIFVTLRSRVAKDKHPSVSLPVVELDGANVTRRLLAWKDVNVEPVDAGQKVVADKSIKDKLTRHEKDGWLKEVLTWNLAAGGRSLKAGLPKTAPRISVRMLASSETVFPAGKGRWLHGASYWIHAPEATELRVKFPAAAERVGVWIDGHLHTVAQPAAQDLALSLDSSPHPRHVELRWMYPANAEPMEAPSIAAALFDPLLLPAHQRIVWAPAGMHAMQLDADASPSLVPRLLHQAQTDMQIAAALAPESTPTGDARKAVATRLQSARARLREAAYALSLLKSASVDTDRARWRELLQDLTRDNEAFAVKLWGKGADKSAVNPIAAPAHAVLTGIPLVVSPTLPSVALRSDQASRHDAQLTRTGLILLLAISLLVFSCFRHGWRLVQTVVPEIIIAITAGILWYFGISPIGMLVIAAMIVLRSIWLWRAARQRMSRSPSTVQAAKPPASVKPPSTMKPPPPA
jgi:hypothetical protein